MNTAHFFQCSHAYSYLNITSNLQKIPLAGEVHLEREWTFHVGLMEEMVKCAEAISVEVGTSRVLF